ncbi:cytochrome c1-like [Penaeus chinensis]|uniref:cytochrome c1-like n=1 Tax=Penaeus chinensis TaxID=139456 RepID=UPI001FB74B9E|nr:cytochrome c1-like [Penaeus chinensis]
MHAQKKAVPQETDDFDACFKRAFPKEEQTAQAPEAESNTALQKEPFLPNDSLKEEQTAQAPEAESNTAPQKESSLPKASPKEEQTAQALPAKRPAQDEGETSPKKARTTSAEEQGAPREDQAAQPPAGKHARETERQEERPRVAVSQRSLAFDDCFKRVHALRFRDSTASRKPIP